MTGCGTKETPPLGKEVPMSNGRQRGLYSIDMVRAPLTQRILKDCFRDLVSDLGRVFTIDILNNPENINSEPPIPTTGSGMPRRASVPLIHHPCLWLSNFRSRLIICRFEIISIDPEPSSTASESDPLDSNEKMDQRIHHLMPAAWE